MRRAIVLTAAGLLAVAMMMATTASGASEIHVVHPYDTPAKGTAVDEDGDGLMDQGDRVVGWSALFDAAGGERVGTLYDDCVFQVRLRPEVPAGLAACVRILKLEGGTVVLGGLDPAGTGTMTFAVTGGTGVYADTTGDATLTETNHQLDIVVRLAA
jgi:hypothetical protein